MFSGCPDLRPLPTSPKSCPLAKYELDVDTKKKELVGQHKNARAEWRLGGDPPQGQKRAPYRHHLPDDAIGLASTKQATRANTDAGYRLTRNDRRGPSMSAVRWARGV